MLCAGCACVCVCVCVCVRARARALLRVYWGSWSQGWCFHLIHKISCHHLFQCLVGLSHSYGPGRIWDPHFVPCSCWTHSTLVHLRILIFTSLPHLSFSKVHVGFHLCLPFLSFRKPSGRKACFLLNSRRCCSLPRHHRQFSSCFS